MFEYIASGLSYTRVLTGPWNESPNHVELAKRVFAKTNTKYKNHKLGLLYNAYSEKRGLDWVPPYGPYVNTIHTDSGGLQMMQKNKTLTEEIKQAIYKVQCQGSDIAMSFDEIPIDILNSGTDARTNMGMKKFIVSRNKECGIKSGKNVQEQIEFFKKNRKDSEFHARPLIIFKVTHARIIMNTSMLF